MRKLLAGSTLLLLLNFGLMHAQSPQQNGPEVKTAAGVVRGVITGDVAAFKGIPYAAPPVGEFRWRPPQPVKPWKEVRDASNTLHARWGNPGEATSEEKELPRILNAYCANFAKTGNPNGKDLLRWPAYDIQKEEILDIDLDGKAVAKPDPRKERFNVIEKAFKQKRERLQSRGI